MFTLHERDISQVELNELLSKGHYLAASRHEHLTRIARDKMLAETDWWATTDRTMSAEQTAYRQAMRDITAQSGFPTDITWPTKPE